MAPAFVWSPTAVTRAVPSPASTVVAASTVSPTAFSIAADSPVSILSLSSKPFDTITVASAGSSSPALRIISSPTTSESYGTSTAWPSRNTRALGALISSSRCSTRLARIS